MRIAAVFLFLAQTLVARCLAPYWQLIPLTNGPAVSVATADFNGDGLTDIAVMTKSDVFILLNDGIGGFRTPVGVYSNDMLGGTLIAADLDGDGKPDLAFAIFSSLFVLPGKGDGTFGAPVQTPITIDPTSLAAAHFGSDRALDLAGYDANWGKLVILRNAGGGRFSVWQRVSTEPYGTMAVGDLDGDGWTDVILGYNYETISTFDVFYGGSDRNLAPAVKIAGADACSGLQVLDMDGDGRPDLLFTTYFGYVGVIRNSGTRSFSDPQSYKITSTGLDSVTVTDLTGDGRPDLLALDGCGVSTFNVLPDGTPGPGRFAPLYGCDFLLPAATADFDRDGRTDVAIIGRDGVYELRNLCGDGRITATPEPPTISIGQTETIRVAVQPPASLYPPLDFSGTATLFEGERVIASAPVDRKSGLATFTLDGLALGEHTFTADYAGDPQYYELKFIGAVTVHVVTATTTTTLTADRPTGIYAINPQLTAVVTSSTGDTPTGPIRFLVDGKPEYVNASAPTAQIATHNAWFVGTHIFTAAFAGDDAHPPSHATLTYVVGRQTPVMLVRPTFATAGSAGQTFSVVLQTSGLEAASPGGTLTLRNGATILGIQEPSVTGNAFPLPALDAGDDLFRVSYSGDSNYAPVDTNVPFVVLPEAESAVDARGTTDGVVVTWNDPTRVVVRREASQSWSDAVNNVCAPSPCVDHVVKADTVYLYRSLLQGQAPGNADVAMVFAFTDDPLLPETAVTSTHVAEVVRATNILRAAAALPAITLPAVSPMRRRVVGAGSGIPASDVALLRDAINEARQALGAYRYPFTIPIAPGAQIDASQLRELREAIR